MERSNKEMSDLHNKLQQLQAELNRKQLSSKSSEDQLIDIEQDHRQGIDKLAGALKDKDKTIETLVESWQEKDKLIKRLQQVTAASRGTIMDNNRLRDEADKLRNQLAKKKDEISELKLQLDRDGSRSPKAGFHVVLEELKLQLAVKTEALKAAKQTEEDFREQINSLRKQLESAHQSMKEVHTTEKQVYYMRDNSDGNGHSDQYQDFIQRELNELHRIQEAEKQILLDLKEKSMFEKSHNLEAELAAIQTLKRELEAGIQRNNKLQQQLEQQKSRSPRKGSKDSSQDDHFDMERRFSDQSSDTANTSDSRRSSDTTPRNQDIEVPQHSYSWPLENKSQKRNSTIRQIQKPAPMRTNSFDRNSPDILKSLLMEARGRFQALEGKLEATEGTVRLARGRLQALKGTLEATEGTVRLQTKKMKYYRNLLEENGIVFKSPLGSRSNSESNIVMALGGRNLCKNNQTLSYDNIPELLVDSQTESSESDFSEKYKSYGNTNNVSELKDQVRQLKIAMDKYKAVIKSHMSQMPKLWEDINVDVIRSQTVDQTGPCANHRPADDKKTTVLQPGSRYSVVSPAACLEPEREYKIRIKFNSYKTNQATPDATTLIDSIVLTPNIDCIPIFHGIGYPEYMKNEFIRYRCRESQLSVYQLELQDFCRQLTFSISSIIHQKALECQCDPMGSLSSECEYAGGQCRCKPYVVGHRCNKCAPGTDDFGPDGCKPCICHEYGAVDKFCDARTGQCNCISYVGNKICDQCQVGYWGFPCCRPCQCIDRNADTCDDLTGRCDNCNDFTAGDQCDKCLDGYYGDPRINYCIPCRPCLCPGGPTSDVQHADSCYEDPRQQSVVCNCYLGFKGPNYFGNPKDVNGTCELCICNNNIDPNIGGSCDTSSGECLKCMFNTEGFNCEQCSPGYYGDATTQNCKQCICDPYGTDPTGGDCDRVTGQCLCLPNVIGQQCDSCAAGFWNSSCGCDMPGSTRVECNQFDGQFNCVQGRGGRDCASCEDNYWGDPTVQCYACDCNYQGSAQTQCDRRSGQCVCLTGISGYKCDRCDRGTTGVLPNCKPCGDCFNNWDRVIRDLSAQTTELIKSAVDIKATGVESAFNKEFQQMEENLDEIRQIVRNANISSEDIRNLDSLLKSLRQLLSDEFRRLNNTESQFKARMDDIRKGNNDILSLKQRVEELKKKADDLRRNATDIQARDLEGAFNITKEAQQKSRMAQSKVDGTQGMLNESMKTRAEVEKMLEEKRNAFNQKIQENEAELNEMDDKVSSLGSRIADLNEMVCDGRGDPCDSVCGGGGCGKCGGISCDGGALTKADNAIDRANQAKLLLDIKEVDANTMLTEIQQAQQEAEEAKDQAQMAYNKAMKAKNQTEKAKLMLQNVLSDVQDFLGLGRATPDDVKEITEEVLGMSISLTPDQIIELAQKINETIWGLQNIYSILNATRDDLDKAQKLKERAENAKGDANTILGKAQDVLDNLKGATSAQELATVAINKSDTDITNAEADLTQWRELEAELEDQRANALNSRKKLENDIKDLRQQAELAVFVKEDAVIQLKHVQTQMNDNQTELDEKQASMKDIERKLENYKGDVLKLQEVLAASDRQRRNAEAVRDELYIFTLFTSLSFGGVILAC
ncbi:laminin subunit beta-1-like [Mytilus trossulus]|uniref:laminin subunit beta-1-like n=1 Tax=Mytilus trossulus TaxID=6551 RepID=UPI003006B3FA